MYEQFGTQAFSFKNNCGFNIKSYCSPLLMHWSYFFLALTPRFELWTHKATPQRQLDLSYEAMPDMSEEINNLACNQTQWEGRGWFHYKYQLSHWRDSHHKTVIVWSYIDNIYGIFILPICNIIALDDMFFSLFQNLFSSFNPSNASWFCTYTRQIPHNHVTCVMVMEYWSDLNLVITVIAYILASVITGERFKNTCELLNLRALKFSPVNKIHIFHCMGKIFCVEFQRVPLEFHT